MCGVCVGNRHDSQAVAREATLVCETHVVFLLLLIPFIFSHTFLWGSIPVASAAAAYIHIYANNTCAMAATLLHLNECEATPPRSISFCVVAFRFL